MSRTRYRTVIPVGPAPRPGQPVKLYFQTIGRRQLVVTFRDGQGDYGPIQGMWIVREGTASQIRADFSLISKALADAGWAAPNSSWWAYQLQNAFQAGSEVSVN